MQLCIMVKVKTLRLAVGSSQVLSSSTCARGRQADHGGKLTQQSAEATGRQRPDLLAQGDGIHVETSIGSVQEDLAGVEPPSRPIGSTWDNQKHGTRCIDRIAADDHHWPDPSLF